jgi:hypothetical protein
MDVLGFFGLIAVVVGAWWWAALPRLRKLPWWGGFVGRLSAFGVGAYARLRGLCGNSRTIAIAYASEILGLLDGRACSTGRSSSAPKTPAASWWRWAR